MMPFSARSTVTCVLLTLGILLALLAIAWLALQLSGTWLAPFEALWGKSSYFACWRALLYTLISAGWVTALHQQRAVADQQRLKQLGLIGFGSIVLVELSRV